MDLIKSISSKTEFKTNEKLEWELLLTPNWFDLILNPFDTSLFKVIATFKDPKGKSKEVYGFYFEDYSFEFEQNKDVNSKGIWGESSTNLNEPQGIETYKRVGEPKYLIRHIVKEEGLYNLTINIYFNNEVIKQIKESFEVQKGDNISKGVLQIDELNKRNFKFSNNETFIPIGQNNAWFTSPTRKTIDYQVWFKLMEENGANFTRIWLNTKSFALHSGDDFKNFKTRMVNAKMLDKVIDLAKEHNIYFMLTLLQHGQFSEKVNPAWQYNNWNKINGGILDKPWEFFTNNEAKKIYKEQLIYIVSRWGYLENLAAWELFNEVDWTDNYSSEKVSLWHQEMAQFIKRIDNYNHLVTTSYKHLKGEGYYLKEIEYANPHSYDYFNKNINIEVPKNIKMLYKKYQKPILHSEIGIDWRTGLGTAEKDPLGITIKQSQWAGVMGGSAGGAMNWWWDSFVHPLNLYHHFKGISNFSKNMDMISNKYVLLSELKDLRISSKDIKIIGYLLDDRVYGYLFHKNWTYQNKIKEDNKITIYMPLSDGNYQLQIFDTTLGIVEETSLIKAVNNEVEFKLIIKEDKAFIIKKVK